MSLSEEIKSTALSLGFTACGISPAIELSEDLALLEQRIGLGYHGEMAYLARTPEVRADVRLLVPNAKSVISVLLNYNSSAPETTGPYKISRYAWGTDYHVVINEKLKQLQQWLEKTTGVAGSRAGVDSGPVFEKRLAQRAGLGWMGKHNVLINKKSGTWCFIGEIITTLELDYDTPETDHCGNCRLCIDACPTAALTGEHCLDARKCISYLTISYKGDFDESTPKDFKNHIYGCDICQEVCPWNKKAEITKEPGFMIHNPLLFFSKEQWESLDEPTFEKLSASSAMNRTGYKQLKRNIQHLQH